MHVSLNADHKNCYIEVADSGIGIPAEAQEHIFERFYRVDKSHSREIGGTGLVCNRKKCSGYAQRGDQSIQSAIGRNYFYG